MYKTHLLITNEELNYIKLIQIDLSTEKYKFGYPNVKKQITYTIL